MDHVTLQQYIFEIVWPAFLTTLQVLCFTVSISTVIGFGIAVLLNITRPEGLHPNRNIYRTMDIIINLIRSFPFVILIVSLIPVTRFLTGSSIGVQAAIFPLCVSMSPYMGRLIQTHMDQVSKETIEAAKSFGASTWQIIWHIILVESIPGISSVICFATVAALNATTVAGMVGAGGLGNVAIRYGYNEFNDGIMYSTVAILIVLVQLIQFTGNKIYNKLK
ncbi:MAG: methionine ABC transporter permease [Oscillospiraceae bacterium]